MRLVAPGRVCTGAAILSVVHFQNSATRYPCPALEDAAGLSPIGDISGGVLSDASDISARDVKAIKPHLAAVAEEIRARVEQGEDRAQG